MNDIRLGGYKVEVEVRDPEGRIIGTIHLTGSDVAQHVPGLEESYTAGMEVGGIFRGPNSPQLVSMFFQAVATSVATTSVPVPP